MSAAPYPAAKRRTGQLDTRIDKIERRADVSPYAHAAQHPAMREPLPSRLQPSPAEALQLTLRALGL